MTQTAISKAKMEVFALRFDGTSTPVKTILFLVLCAAWILPGLVGHQPWKFDEAIALGIVDGMLRSGDWVVPAIGGEPYVVRPPLYHWTAALLAHWMAPALPVHDAARLASGVYVALAMLCVSATGLELFGQRQGRLPVLILTGCIGLLLRAHEMNPDTALLFGYALALYGAALGRRRAAAGGALAGLGVGVGFLARGPIVALAAVLVLVLLPLAGATWRRIRFPLFVPCALAVAAPLCAGWPYALAMRDAALLDHWLWGANLSLLVHPVRTLAAAEPLYYVSILPWYAWPALPIALWSLWRQGLGGAEADARRFLLLAATVLLVVLSLTPSPHEGNAMPLLLPLALLAAAAIDRLERGAASALDWFGIMTFGLFSALLWTGWVALITGEPLVVARYLERTLPGYRLPFGWGAFVTAAILTLLWLAAMARALRSNRRAIVNWTAGITTVWMLAMTLWLPFIDAARSYQSVAASLSKALEDRRGCIGRQGIGDPQRALFAYYAAIETRPLDRSEDCPLLIVQGHDALPPEPSHWIRLWEGARPGDRNERYVLYRRTKH